MTLHFFSITGIDELDILLNEHGAISLPDLDASQYSESIQDLHEFQDINEYWYILPVSVRTTGQCQTG